MNTSLYLAVAFGGLVGAPSRYLLDRYISGRVESDLPWGTFTINISGALLLGFLIGLSIAGHLPLLAKTLLGTGFCGAYTTFSTFTFETLRLFEEGNYLESFGYAFISANLGLAAATAGVAIGIAL